MNGDKQCGHIGNKEAASSTVSMESVSLTAAMEAKQGCKVQTCNTPNAFMQTQLDDMKVRIILTSCGLAAELLCEIPPVHKPFLETERGQLVSHLESANVTHGTLKAALSFHKSFENDVRTFGFDINQHDC